MHHIHAYAASPYAVAEEVIGMLERGRKALSLAGAVLCTARLTVELHDLSVGSTQLLAQIGLATCQIAVGLIQVVQEYRNRR